MNSVVASANLVKKVKLPLAVFPVAAVCSHAVNFALAMIVLVAGMIVAGLAPGPLVVLVPLLLALQMALIAGVALLLASLNVFYRDVASIWEVAGAAWFYATPIIYPAYSALEYFDRAGRPWAAWLYLANPMTAVTLAYRRVLLYGSVPDGAGANFEIDDGRLLVSLGIACIVAIGGLAGAERIFRKLSRRFADEL
jgi:ABC-type polysaccharide/polyol phosphate export permease